MAAPCASDEVGTARHVIVALVFGFRVGRADDVVGAGGGGAAVVDADAEGVGAVVCGIVAGAGEGLDGPA